MAVVTWPPHLVQRIADGDWVLFIGSGVSASCQNDRGESPPTWTGLLQRLCDLIADPGLKAIGDSLIAQNELLAAADHIRYVLADEGNLNGYSAAVREAVEGPAGHSYAPSALHDQLLELNPRIVFTTNYDKLFETASRNGFKSHPYDSPMLGADLRRGVPVLVKLHGTTDMIDRIVLTRTDFIRAMDEGRKVFDLLNALSLTSTFLFVGYSLSDPDIQLVLQEVGRGALDPEAHFMLLEEPASPAQVPVFRESFGLTVLTYPAGHHDLVQTSLVELGDEVLALRQATLGVP